jgi:hypothetical protein
LISGCGKGFCDPIKERKYEDLFQKGTARPLAATKKIQEILNRSTKEREARQGQGQGISPNVLFRPSVLLFKSARIVEPGTTPVNGNYLYRYIS